MVKHSLTRSLLITLFSYALSAQPLSVAQSSAKFLPSVVKIKVQQTDTLPQESEFIQSDMGGTGFVFDDNHHILTNAHVIKEAKKIAVVDVNNTQHTATLLAKDDKADIAILYVPTLNAPLIPIADTTSLALGDNVFAIGSPYSLGLGVTVGVVSALERYLPNYPYGYFIQTDAAINPGNSGGPLFNQNGELIGVATMTFSRSGGYTNIGFAIPINEAIRIGNLLIAQKKVNRGFLGADLLISDKVSRKFGVQSSVLITHVEIKGPASLAGLRAGDVLTELNDQKFTDSATLHRYLEHSKPNESLTLTYLRDKKSLKTTVTLSETPIKALLLNNIGTADATEKLGLIVQENSPLEVILSYGPAKVTGIAAGDKILQINTVAVTTIKELNAQLSKLKENEFFMLTLQRNGDLITLPLGSKTAIVGYSTTN